MAKRRNNVPVIPEPSPRFAFWSGVAAAVALIAMLAVGVMLNDCTLENGPLLVVPGSHTGPIWDHHADGYFCGAVDPASGPEQRPGRDLDLHV